MSRCSRSILWLARAAASGAVISKAAVSPRPQHAEARAAVSPRAQLAPLHVVQAQPDAWHVVVLVLPRAVGAYVVIMQIGMAAYSVMYIILPLTAIILVM